MAEKQTTATSDEAVEPIVGHVTRIQGSVIDVEFPVGHMPDIYNALTVEINQMGQQEEGEQSHVTIMLEVEQHMGDSTARCVALKSTDGLVRGAAVHDTGGPIEVPVGDVTKGHVFDVAGHILNKKPNEKIEIKERWPIHRNPPAFDQLESKTQMFETGIKVIDLLTPYVQGGKIGEVMQVLRLAAVVHQNDIGKAVLEQSIHHSDELFIGVQGGKNHGNAG